MHDYVGLLSEVPNNLMEKSGLNLKATELRLGLPGSESPERERNNNKNGKSVILSLKSFVGSGAKRGFSDAIDGKWVFCGSGPEAAVGGLFSPISCNNCKSNNTINSGKVLVGSVSGLGRSVVKEGGGCTFATAQSPKPVMVVQENKSHGVGPSSKAQVVGWPPIRSFRKNTMSSHSSRNDDDSETKLGLGCVYVKVSMDGAPYLRKVDLKTCSSYMEFSSALEKMFSCFTIGQCGSHNVSGQDALSEIRLMDLLHGSEYVLTYEDKEGDWMLVGDVPWELFTESCKRLRIMKSSEAIGLAPRAMEKCKNRN